MTRGLRAFVRLLCVLFCLFFWIAFCTLFLEQFT